MVVVAGSVGLADTGRHTVEPGETASDIALEHGVSIADLVEANGLDDPDRIIAGQVLVIPGADVTHTVARGESLATIARRYGTTVSAIASANGITDPDLVRIGQVLTIPAGTGGGGSGGGGGSASTTHTVARGETLASIAGRYGTTAAAIASANGIANPNLVVVGQVLTIPAGSGGSGGVPSSHSAYDLTGGADGRTGVSGTHVVARGETLASIARRYGVDPLDLAAANGLLQPGNVYADARYRLDAGNDLPTDFATCPVPGATFVNDWGFPRSGGRAHEGNDLFAPRGTAVVAPVAGTVTTATGTIGGRQFRLETSDGTVILGSHMDAFGATGPVEAGEVIGRVGNSGNAAGSRTHLHFEVHPGNGAAMNPYPLIHQVC